MNWKKKGNIREGKKKKKKKCNLEFKEDLKVVADKFWEDNGKMMP